MLGQLIIANRKGSKDSNGRRVHKQINQDQQALLELRNSILPGNKINSATIIIAVITALDNRETANVQLVSKTVEDRVPKIDSSNRTAIARIAVNRFRRRPSRRNLK
jgi:hypothetical protein